MAEGVTHISCHHTRIRSRETGENRKTNEQTRTKLGVTKSRGRYCNIICMCGLSLAWATSENSTMLLESDILRLFFTGPYLMLPRFSARCLVLTAPPFFHANFSSAACLSALQPPTANCLCCLPLSGPRRQLSFASPYHFRVRRDFMSKNPLSGFAPKQTIESSALAAYPHSATICPKSKNPDETYTAFSIESLENMVSNFLWHYSHVYSDQSGSICQYFILWVKAITLKLICFW